MIGLDTTAIIDFFKEDKSLKKILDQNEETLASTIINHQEIMFGLDITDKKHMGEKVDYNQFFEELVLFPHSIKSSTKSAEIFWQLKKKGMEIGKLDCMIAGILLANGVNKIITRKVGHFKTIKDLEVISY